MTKMQFSGVITAVALIAGGAGACGSDEPATPPQPSRTPMESPTKPDRPKPQNTDDQPLPEECRHPAGASVRERCIEEYGPEGVGTVPVVPPERDRNNNGIDDSVEEPEPTQDDEQVPSKEEQIEQCIEQTGSPEACREKIDPSSEPSGP